MMESPREMPSPEVLLTLHEKIARYCRQCWLAGRLAPDLFGDATQDVVLRLYEEGVLPDGAREIFEQSPAPSHARIVFLRAINTVRRRYQRQYKRRSQFSSLSSCNAPACRDDNEAEKRDLVQLVLHATEKLTSRNAAVITLILEGVDSAAEIGRLLSMKPEDVHDARYRSIKKLRELLCGAA